ncbi:ABC transporter substrate-binding protein [Kitasatospora cinereorecta]|uniref:ABC transporter substrate-binding protein n=1 Tax=Kitasatospora cinereorecta TaxID=285560 RepID=A0ABW0V308_9ACTN
MSPVVPDTSRRGFLAATSMLFVAGAAVTACSPFTSGPEITLQQWYHAYGEAGTKEAVKRYAAAYTKANPKVAVNITWVTDEYEAHVTSMLEADRGPDLFEFADFRRRLVLDGRVAPLDDVIRDYQVEFSRSTLDVATVNNRIYGIKMVDDIMMLYYRKSALAKARINPPTTFDELVHAAKVLTGNDRKGLYVGTNGIGDAGYLLLWSAGQELVRGNRVAFNTPEAAQALAGLRRLTESKVLLKDLPGDWQDPTPFIQGTVAMQWCGLWAMPAIDKQLEDDYGVLPWPSFGTSGAPVTRVGGWYQLVNAKSAHLEEAKKYAAWLWLQQSAIQKDFSVSYGFHVPARSTVAATTVQLVRNAAADNTVDLARRYGRSFPNIWNAGGTAFDTALTAIAGGSDPAGELSKAAASCQAEVDRQQG